MPVTLDAGSIPITGYRLIRKLGKGGFGEVWEAEAPGGFHVALKFIEMDNGLAEKEARALDVIKNIRHPHLLDVQFAVQIDDYLIIASPLCERSLMDRLKECQGHSQAGIPLAELLGYMEDAAKAIDYLNEPHHPGPDGRKIGVQHRDIKPHNLFLVGGSVRVADFGLARFIEGSAASHSGSMTPYYAPPEVFGKSVAVTSDQYSLAVTYYHARCGHPPFQGSPNEVMFGHLQTDPDLSSLPVAEQSALGKALAKEPGDRWPNCQAFVAALKRANQSVDDDVVRDRTFGTETSHSGNEPQRMADTLGRSDLRSADTPIDSAKKRFTDSNRRLEKPTNTWKWIIAASMLVVALVGAAYWRMREGQVIVEFGNPKDPQELKAAMLDEQSIELASLSGTIDLRAGEHTLAVTWHDGQTTFHKFEVERGQASTVRLARPKQQTDESADSQITKQNSDMREIVVAKEETEIQAKTEETSDSTAKRLEKNSTREQADPMPIDVAVHPSSARVKVDGEEVALTGEGRLVVEPRNRTSIAVNATAAGFEPYERRLAITELRGSDFAIRMEAKPRTPPVIPPVETKRETVSLADVLTAIHKHLTSKEETDRSYQRYFVLHHLHNQAGIKDADLHLARATFAKAINSLSWKNGLVIPESIDPAQTVLAIDMRDVGWEQNWLEVEKVYPYGLKFDRVEDPKIAELAKEVQELSGRELAFVRADWFVATATSAPLYDSLLGLPMTTAELEAKLRVDVEREFARKRVIRSVVRQSKEGNSSRIIDRFNSAYGAYWKAHDFPLEKGAEILRELTGNADAHEYSGKSESVETLFHLPNGLVGYHVASAEGNPMPKSHRTTGLTCIGCHAGGIVSFTNDREVERKPENLAGLIAKDQQKYFESIESVDAALAECEREPLKDQESNEPLATLTARYQKDLNIETLAAELGFSDQQTLRDGITANHVQEPFLEPVLEGQPLLRREWERLDNFLSPFQRAASALGVGTPHRSL